MVIEYDRTAVVITRQQPDVVALQELTKHFSLHSGDAPTYPADDVSLNVNYL